jgi:two-component system chemotaxis response regulator CheB
VTRVVICEDSRTYAAALARVLAFEGDIEVVGVFDTAEKAIAAVPQLAPNLVTMDIELPGMSGLEAVEQLMASNPLPVLVLSSYAGRGSEQAAAALAAGALDAIPKDELDLRDPSGVAARAFRNRVKLLSGARVIRHPRARLRREPTRPNVQGRRAAVIGLCASTGGPPALAAVIESLSADFAVPILVVQHIAAGFTEGLVQWLKRAAALPVELAREGDALAPGVWVAPEGAHLVVERDGRLGLDRATVSGHHRPSGDLMLRSLADTAGSLAVAVVLTGMGRDGAQGAAAVRAAGGLAIAQDEATSAIYGMPRAAVEAGVDLVLSPSEIAATLAALEPVPMARRR